jgi:hypothetical protein
LIHRKLEPQNNAMRPILTSEPRTGTSLLRRPRCPRGSSRTSEKFYEHPLGIL